MSSKMKIIKTILYTIVLDFVLSTIQWSMDEHVKLGKPIAYYEMVVFLAVVAISNIFFIRLLKKKMSVQIPGLAEVIINFLLFAFLFLNMYLPRFIFG